MKNTIKQKIATGIAVGAIGLGSLVGGCESYNEYDTLSLASTSAVNESTTPEQALFWGLMSDHFKEQGNRYDRRQVAEENIQRTQWVYLEKNGKITKRMDLARNIEQEYKTLVLHYPEGIGYLSGWITGEGKNNYIVESTEENKTTIYNISKENFVGFAAE